LTWLLPQAAVEQGFPPPAPPKLHTSLEASNSEPILLAAKP